MKEYNYAGRQRMKKYKGCRNTKDVEIQRIQKYKECRYKRAKKTINPHFCGQIKYKIPVKGM